jgi:acetyl-CoA C-acetyltransferase
MTSIDSRTPVVIGVAQKTVHKGRQPAPEPLVTWEEVVRAATIDGGLSARAIASVDAISLTHCMSWAYDDGIGSLAQRLGAKPTICRSGLPSGTSGQTLLADLADDIRAGRAEFAVLCGGEALATVKHYSKAGQAPPWSFRSEHPEANHVNLVGRQHPGEVAIGLFEGVGAVYGFAMRDLARRAHLGIGPDAYRQQLGDTLAGLTRAAARNPDAWAGFEREPEFLITPREDNRWVTYPYTKHMVANIDVDISAAIIIASEAKANELGVPREKRIYPWTSAYAEDPVFIAVRDQLWKADGMEIASKAALDAAGISMKDVSYVDIYSCFAAAVNFTRDALGISDWAGDRVSVTGGLPYGGGPSSSYMLTSLVKTIEKLRGDPGSFGLVTGVGMMMSNHVFAVYSSKPPAANVRTVDNSVLQSRMDAIPQRAIDDTYTGRATVATYTVMHDRKGDISHGAAICDLPSGARAYVRILDKELLAEAERTEFVGRHVMIKPGRDVGELALPD